MFPSRLKNGSRSAVAPHRGGRDGGGVAVRRGGRLATRAHEFLGQSAARRRVHLPLVLPPVVTGYLLLISFGRHGPIGAFLDQCCGIVFSFRWTGAALACGVMGFPLLVRRDPALDRGHRPRLEDAAATLGADRLWVFLTVTLPLAVARASSPEWCSASPKRWANSAPRSHSSPTFPAKPRPFGRDLHIHAGARRRRAAGRLVIVAIVISLAALIASEWLARRAGMRFHGE